MTTTTTVTTTATTTAPSFVPHGPTRAILTFYSPPPDNSAPFNYVESAPPGEPQRNYREQQQEVALSDIRGADETTSYTLDKDAFQTVQNVCSAATYSTFDSDAAIRQTYYPEVVALLKTHVPGAQKIIIFDHTIRRQSPDAPRQPVVRAHVDQTPRAAAERVRLHVSDPAEAEAVLAAAAATATAAVEAGAPAPTPAPGAPAAPICRYRIINVWRPLDKHDLPVQSVPLAFATATSVDRDDLVPIEHRYPHRNGEIMGVKYSPNQRWLYWSGMAAHERLLLKCSDSAGLANPDIAQCVPHTAFWHPDTPAGARPRESIEVRALVLGN